MQDQRIRDMVRALRPSQDKPLWYGGATLIGSLRGVSAEQAAWKPQGLKNSIWRLALHCAYSQYLVRRKFAESEERGTFPRKGGYWPALPEAIDDKTWAADRALLREEHQHLVEAVAGFDPARLDDLPPGNKRWTYADLLLGVVQHDTYHTGQIQVLKRLWAQEHIQEY